MSKLSTMDVNVLTFVMLSFCVSHCFGQRGQHKRKLDRLQLKVDDLNDLATDLRLDIADLQSWRNATVARARDTGVIDADNECLDSQLLGGFEQSLDDLEGRVKYIIKGLEGEKMALRETVENNREEVCQKSETKFEEERNKMEKAFDTKLNQHKLKTESKLKEKETKMQKAFDAKLNQHMLKTESEDAEINDQLSRIWKQLETLRKDAGEDHGQIEVVSNPVDAVSTTVKDVIGTMKNRDDQYYISMKKDGWLLYKNYLYKLSSELVNFDTAVKRCQYQDAYLVEITDQEEKQFLIDNFTIYWFWVGATDRRTEGEWRWLSGPSVGDDNWALGQPNGGSGEGCMLTVGTTLRYYDYSCTRNTYYVCKRQ